MNNAVYIHTHTHIHTYALTHINGLYDQLLVFFRVYKINYLINAVIPL